MRKIRIISQIVFFLAFSILILFINSYPIAYKFESNILLKLNPLTMLFVGLSSHSIILDLLIISSIVLLVTIFFGRIFCGAVCPLGSMIDFVDHLCAKTRSLERRPPIYLHRLKYVIFSILLFLSIFGVLVPLFFDPLLLSTRIFTFIIDPLMKIIYNSSIDAVSVISRDTANYLYLTYPISIPLYLGLSLTIFLSMIIFAGTFWDRRFWCQYICPTGAFLGIMSRFSFFRHYVKKENCNSCSRCTRICPTRAINPKDVQKTSYSECIECGLCVEQKNICNTFSIKKPSSKNSLPLDIKRRHLLAGLAGGALLLPTYKATASIKRDDHGKLIRPPGSLPEKEFKTRCIACGKCMKACPTNALQPCMFTDGFSNLYTPKIVPKIGGCEGQCALCGNVCPTNAIRKISPEEKPYIKIGTAVIDRNKCLAWEQNKECVVCDEVCPFNAIDSRELDTVGGKFTVPIVREDLCMGCGMCEHHCPVNDFAAISVYRFGENRKSKGSYVTEHQKQRMIEERKKTGNEKDHQYNSEINGSQKNKNTLPEGFSEEKSDELPEGFSSEKNEKLPEGFTE